MNTAPLAANFVPTATLARLDATGQTLQILFQLFTFRRPFVFLLWYTN
jgi:hypothetical protein